MVIKKKIITIDTSSNNILLAIQVNCDEFNLIDTLQKELSVDFKIQQPRSYELSSGITTLHAYYMASDEYRKLQIRIIANKTDKGALIDFMDSINFFVEISAIDITAHAIVQNIQLIPIVLYAQKIDIQKYAMKQQKYFTQLFY